MLKEPEKTQEVVMPSKDEVKLTRKSPDPKKMSPEVLERYRTHLIKVNTYRKGGKK